MEVIEMKKYYILLLIVVIIAMFGTDSFAAELKGVHLFSSLNDQHTVRDTHWMSLLDVDLVGYHLRAFRGEDFDPDTTIRNFNPDSLAPAGALRWLRVRLDSVETFNFNPGTETYPCSDDWFEVVRNTLIYHTNNGGVTRPETDYFQFFNEPAHRYQLERITYNQMLWWIDLIESTYVFADSLLDSLYSGNRVPKLVFPGFHFYGQGAYNNNDTARAFGEDLIELADTLYAHGDLDYFSFHHHPKYADEDYGSTDILEDKYSGYVDTFGLDVPMFIDELSLPYTKPDYLDLFRAILYASDTISINCPDNPDSVVYPFSIIQDFVDSCWIDDTTCLCTHYDLDTFIWNNPCLFNKGVYDGDTMHQLARIHPDSFYNSLDSKRVILFDSNFTVIDTMSQLVGFLMWKDPVIFIHKNYPDTLTDSTWGCGTGMTDVIKQMLYKKHVGFQLPASDSTYSNVTFGGARFRDYSFSRFIEPFDGEADVPVSSKPILSNSYPNPYNCSVTITYYLPRSGEVKLEVFNILGQKVATLVDAVQEQGEYKAQWDARGKASGTYFYRLKTDDDIVSKKMTLVK
jgi:hypothetical protein